MTSRLSSRPNVILFLETQKTSAAPFYLGVHYTAPHSPWDREHHPAEIYDDYHRNCPFTSVPREPPHPWQINSAPLGDTDEARRSVLSGYFAAITAMDRNVGRVLDWLERAGMRQNTLVIFTSDNGMNMGHHGLYGKGNASFPFNMFDTSVKVHMLVSMPGHGRSRAFRHRDGGAGKVMRCLQNFAVGCFTFCS